MTLVPLWVPVTLVAAGAQVARNLMQRRLVETIGTAGATQVRFLYGFPFACLFLAVAILVVGEGLPRPGTGFGRFLALGAVAQILATALMLAAMRERSFSVVTATIKTEPVQVAVFGLVVLGDPLAPASLLAILIATLGVLLATTRTGLGDLARSGARPILFGLGAGGLFALSAVGLRGAILALDGGGALMRATTALVWSLGLQSAILLVWLALFDRAGLVGSFRVWRRSAVAGCLGAAGSQLWFLGFALTSAANVRTLALVEVLIAHAVSHRYLGQRATRPELVGMALIVAGVGLLLVAQAA